ncbi:MAG: glycoside hydrolase family 3 N-terminal domain-containing protein [Thermodesulfobacteriota bacterium]
MDLEAADRQWVEKTLSSLSPRERIGQLLVPLLQDGFVSPADIVQMAGQYCLGGVHYFGGSLEESRALARELQAAVKVPIFITGDLDKGGGDRIEGGTLFQSQMALGAADDEALAYDLGRAIAMENLVAGYNWTFSPIVDLCGTRDYLRHVASIGEDPEQVARLACAQIRGIQSLGMAACAKHFPGDGFDDRDQHLTTAVNPLSKQQWHELSGYTFKKAIEAGVWSIMNSCLACPALDPGHGDPRFPRPSVISRPLIEDVLRRELGFEGVIITDAINMGGVSMHAPWMERCVLALDAGNDMLLFVRNVPGTVDCLEQCLEAGRLTAERIDQSVRRVLTMKAKMGLHRPGLKPFADPEAPKIFVDSPCRPTARRLAEKSITLLTDSRGWIPLLLEPGARVASIFISNRDDFGIDIFEKTLTEAGHRVTSLRNPWPEEMYDRVEAGEFDAVLTGFYYPIQWGWATPRLHGPQIRSLMSGFHLARPGVKYAFISWCSPYHLYELAFMDPFLVTYGETPIAQETTARMLLGQLPITGRVPVSLEGFFKRGDGIKRST